MAYKYRAGYGPKKHRGRKVALIIFCALLVVGGLAGAVLWDAAKNQSSTVSGPGHTVAQVLDEQTATPTTVDEQLYTLQLPAEWKEVDRRNSAQELSVTWQAKKKGEDNRWLKVYVDRIPPDLAINRLLPVDAVGDTVAFRQLSENCTNFTAAANKQLPAPSKWQQVNFICDLPNYVQNKVGTGSTEGVNSVKITGQTRGEHRYFFMFTDHNNTPDYNIFYSALKSFKAK